MIKSVHDYQIDDVFKKDAPFYYVIPKYQREYTWSTQHWKDLYNTLSQEWFVEKLQDYGTFEADLTTIQVDAYYLTLMEQISDLKEEIIDNQALIIAFGDEDTYLGYQHLSAQQIANIVDAAFREAGAGLDESIVSSAFHNAMQQAAMA